VRAFGSGAQPGVDVARPGAGGERPQESADRAGL
jgi:hypothetical protein